MPDQDDRLPADLQEYYRQLAQQPAPDVTARVMLSTDTRTRRIRRWGTFGGGLLAAGAAVAVIVIALANHRSPVSVGPAQSPTPGASATAAPTFTPTPAPSPPVPLGAAAHGFVPTDVTAVSAAQWWVLGYNGPTCSSASCTRILSTHDGGVTFTSIPVPPVAPANGNQQQPLLRFADAVDAWVVSPAGAVWATHDGGAHWTQDAGAGAVTDLEASGGSVYAISCGAGAQCAVEASPVGRAGWSTLAASTGHGGLSDLQVNGAHLWVAVNSPGGGAGTVLASTDGGQSFSTETVCPTALGFAHVYAVDDSTLWAVCATGTQASAYLSVDGGAHFTPVQAPSLANSATIAGTSSTTAVIGAQTIVRTTDSGQTFSTVESTQTVWKVVGFTTSSNGFAFDLQPSLWRTNDGGGHWFRVQFP